METQEASVATTEPTNPPVVETTETSAPVTPETTDAQEQEVQDASGDEPTADQRRSKGVQKRLDELTREKYEWKRLAERREQQLEAMLARVMQPQEARQPVQEAPQPVAQKPKPTPEQFQTYEDYVEAAADWRAEQRLTAYFEAERQRAEQAKVQQQQARQQESLSQFKQRLKDAGTGKYADFHDVALHRDLPVSETMIQALMDSDHAADVLYFLGKNPSEAERIFEIGNPAAVGREIGKIEHKLTNAPKPEKRVTMAPDPITPIGSSEVVEKGPDKMTMQEYAAWRNKQDFGSARK